MKGIYRITLLALLLLLLQACGGREYNYQDSNNRPDTPGLITGEAGEYHILQAQGADKSLPEQGGGEEPSVCE